MTIKLAGTAGFCFGVGRAVEMAERIAKESGEVCTLGQLIHNSAVTNKLLSDGVGWIDSIDSAPRDATVIIRAHGESREVIKRAKQMDIRVVDMTCPFVARIHEIVSAESEDGRLILIMGDPDHPEISGIVGWCREARVFKNGEALVRAALQNPENIDRPVSIVAQTTSDRTKWEFFVNSAKKVYTNIKIFDTICYATDERQAECALIASESDAMLVIGDGNSSNTEKLCEVARTKCRRVYRISGMGELDRRWFKKSDRVGITAGASTPAWIIKEVVNKMSEEMKNLASDESQLDAEQTFEQMLEDSIKTLYTGDKVTGMVTAITSGEINVDLGVKQAGYIPVAELSDDPDYNVEEHIKVGDEIEAFVMRVNDVEGTVMLSKKRLDTIKGWDSIEDAREARTTVEGTVIEENKGGVVVTVNGVHVFVPASHTGIPKDAPLTELIKKRVRLRIIDVNRARRRVVGSIRIVQQDERRERAEQIWNEIEENKVYNGVIKSLTSYGAFVDIGGVDGMVHISELSWKRIRHPSEVVTVGENIEVFVLSFDREKRKISLGYRKTEDNPWNMFIRSYGIGDIIPVKVLKFMQFGAFAEVLPGVDGLIHISQIANQRINKPDDALTIGEIVNVKITDIDTERQKISLSIRAIIEDHEQQTRVMADEQQSATVYSTDEE